MEIIIFIIIGAIVLFAITIGGGHAIGPPEAKSMSVEQILARMQSEGAWIDKYKSLPYENQQGAGIKKQYEEKMLYMTELQLQLMQHSTEEGQETLIPILQRSIELMKQGMSEEEANAQASNEYVAKRDASSTASQNET